MPRAMVIGSPIEHSLSPALHEAGYAASGLDEWHYSRAEVTAATFEQFMTGLPDDVVGLSVTMPCKEPALGFADHVSELAQQVGAANTLVRRSGQWHADNTDVAGIVNALAHAGLVEASSAVVAGAGATSRSFLAAARQLGVHEVTFVVRSSARRETLAYAQSLGMAHRVVSAEEAAPYLAAADVLASTLPAGAADGLANVIAAHELSLNSRFAFDVVYDGWPTKLAQVSEHAGATVVSGLEMLIEQAAVQFELFTGVTAPIADMRTAGHSRVK